MDSAMAEARPIKSGKIVPAAAPTMAPRVNPEPKSDFCFLDKSNSSDRLSSAGLENPRQMPKLNGDKREISVNIDARYRATRLIEVGLALSLASEAGCKRGTACAGGSDSNMFVARVPRLALPFAIFSARVLVYFYADSSFRHPHLPLCASLLFSSPRKSLMLR